MEPKGWKTCIGKNTTSSAGTYTTAGCVTISDDLELVRCLANSIIVQNSASNILHKGNK